MPVGTQRDEDKVFPFEIWLAEYFFPTHKDIMESNKFSAELAFEAATVMRLEFCETGKGHCQVSVFHPT